MLKEFGIDPLKLINATRPESNAWNQLRLSDDEGSFIFQCTAAAATRH